jgi:prophage regulatory protein
MTLAIPGHFDLVLRIHQVVEITTYSRAHIYRMMAAAQFPRPIRLGPNRVGWRKSAIEEWVAQRERSSLPTSEPGLKSGPKRAARSHV